jgi:hypothetical protein
MAPATHVSPLGFGDWIIGPDSGRVTGKPEVIKKLSVQDDLAQTGWG